MNTSYALIIVIIIYFLFVENNYNSFINMNFILGESTYSSVNINEKTLNDIKHYIININKNNDFVFIDFGCGIGNVLMFFKNNFKKLIGVENDTMNANLAKKNTSLYKNIFIINQDILNYTFTTTNTILYFYEPLFTVNYCDAMKIYNTLFDNINKVFTKNSLHKIYIIYVSGILRKDITHDFINKKKFKIIRYKKNGALLLYKDIYIISK